MSDKGTDLAAKLAELRATAIEQGTVISIDVQPHDRGRRDIELVTWQRRDDSACGRPDVIGDIDRVDWEKTRPGAVKTTGVLEDAE